MSLHDQRGNGQTTATMRNMIDYDLARGLVAGPRGRELDRVVYKGASLLRVLRVRQLLSLRDLCYRFTRAYTLYVRHAGRSGGDYQTSNRPIPLPCRKRSFELLLVGILCTPSGQNGYCALCYAPFPESKMLLGDGAHRGIYPSPFVRKNCHIESYSSAALQ